MTITLMRHQSRGSVSLRSLGIPRKLSTKCLKCIIWFFFSKITIFCKEIFPPTCVANTSKHFCPQNILKCFSSTEVEKQKINSIKLYTSLIINGQIYFLSMKNLYTICSNTCIKHYYWIEYNNQLTIKTLN